MVTLVDDRTQSGQPLLATVMKNGKRTTQPESLAAIRERAASQLARLPRGSLTLDTAEAPYRVDISPALRELTDGIDRAAPRPPTPEVKT